MKTPSEVEIDILKSLNGFSVSECKLILASVSRMCESHSEVRSIDI